MNQRRLLTLALLGALVVQADAQEPPRSWATPQEVFEIARVGLQKQDLGALCECLTEDSRDLLGGGLMLRLLIARKSIAAAGKEEDKLLMKKIDQVLSKHSLNDTHLEKFQGAASTFRKDDSKTRLKTSRAVLEPVSNRNAFIAELVAVLHKNNAGNAVGGVLKSRSELTDVRIDNDSAKGTVLHIQDGKKTTNEIHFKKIGGSWKIDMTAELNKALGS